MLHYDPGETLSILNQEGEEGLIRVFCLGVSFDLLTLWGEILTVAVIEAHVFDETFRDNL